MLPSTITEAQRDTESKQSSGRSGILAVDAERDVVLVWDLDETLIIFNSLLNGALVTLLGAEAERGEATALGDRWTEAVFELLDTVFDFQQYEEVEARVENEVDLADAESLADQEPSASTASPELSSLRRVAESYRRAQSLYAQGLDALLPSARADAVRRLAAETDAFLQRVCRLRTGWLAHASQLLQACAAATEVSTSTGVERVRAHNLVVTAGQLLPSLAKLVLFGLSPHMAAADVFSAATRRKQSCFERIRARYGPGARFCAVGDGAEERAAAGALGWPFVHICITPPAAASAAPAAAGASAELASQQLTALTAEEVLRRALGAQCDRSVRRRLA